MALPVLPSWLQSNSDDHCWGLLWSEGRHCKDNKCRGKKNKQNESQKLFCHSLSHTWYFNEFFHGCVGLFPFFGFKAVYYVSVVKACNPSYFDLCTIPRTHNSFKGLTFSVELCNVFWPLAKLFNFCYQLKVHTSGGGRVCLMFSFLLFSSTQELQLWDPLT